LVRQADLEAIADLGAGLGEAVIVLTVDAADEGQLLVAAAGFLRRADYLIAPVGRDALRAAWPYSLTG